MTIFKDGDRVWIQRTECVENVDMIRKVQIVEKVYDMPCDDEPDAQAIDIVGSDYLYNNEDLIHEGEKQDENKKIQHR